MNLNSHELKMVAQMRKELHQWRWARWISLILGALCLVNLTLFGSLIAGLLREGNSRPVSMDDVLMMFVLGIKCCFYFIFGIHCFITAGTKWHGDPQKTLLLRLLDARIAGEQPAVK